jgi:hypothetical protein
MPQADDPDIEKLTGRWMAERSIEGAGDCPVAVKDGLRLCFTPTMGGWVQGNLYVNHSEMSAASIASCGQPKGLAFNTLRISSPFLPAQLLLDAVRRSRHTPRVAMVGRRRRERA